MSQVRGLLVPIILVVTGKQQSSAMACHRNSEPSGAADG